MPQRTKLAAVAFALSTIAVATTLFLTSGEELERDALPHLQQANTMVPVKQNADSRAERRTLEKPANIARTPCPPLFGSTVAVTPDATVHVGVQTTIARKLNVPTLVRLANQGDESAALVLFQRARPCSKTAQHMDNMEFEVANPSYLSASECTQLPALLLRNPTDILIPSAQAGSTAAKLLISKNAPTVASVMTILGSGSEQERLNLVMIAEQHGLDAARSGSESAMAWLAHGYLSGTFGRRDAPRAYAIAQASAHSGSAENRYRIGYVYSQLSRAELDSAKSLIYQCSVEHKSDQSIILSPFGPHGR